MSWPWASVPVRTFWVMARFVPWTTAMPELRVQEPEKVPPETVIPTSSCGTDMFIVGANETWHACCFLRDVW